MSDLHDSHSAVITGSSTHNEIIERLWNDVCRSVTEEFCCLFYMLEHIYIPINDVPFTTFQLKPHVHNMELSMLTKSHCIKCYFSIGYVICICSHITPCSFLFSYQLMICFNIRS